MFDLDVIGILFLWAIIALGVPGVLFHLAVASQVQEMVFKAVAWFGFVIAEIALHVVVTQSFVRGWTI